jgi:hypothetical protein
LNYTFVLPAGIGAVGGGHWGFKFKLKAYTGTTNAAITRTGKLHWSVVSNPINDSVGELLSWGHTGLLRPQSGPSHEGFYKARFAFAIVADNLPAPELGSGGCSID